MESVGEIRTRLLKCLVLLTLHMKKTQPKTKPKHRPRPYFKPLVLKDFLDGHQFPGVAQLGLVNHAERAVPDDLGVRVADLLGTIRTLARGRADCRNLTAILVSWKDKSK